MDTPDRSQITSTSLSKFEDSPVFNYINSLSPIESVKSKHTVHSFNLLSFTSPSSVFASPQISSLRESRFLPKSNQSPDPSKSDHPLCGNENKPSEGDLEVAKLSYRCSEQLECLMPETSTREVNAEPLNGPFGLVIESSKMMKYNYGSPIINRVSRDVIERSGDPEMAGASTSFLRSNEDSLREMHSFEKKINLRKVLRLEQSEEAVGCDWGSLIPDVSVLINPNSPIVENESEELEQKIGDPGMVSFISTVLHPPQDNSNYIQKMESASPSSSCKQSEMRELVSQTGEIEEPKDTYQTPDILSSTLLNKLVVSDSKAGVEDNGENCGQSSCKQQKIRRRCLVFEMAGGHKKQSAHESNCSASIQLQSDCKVPYVGKQFVPGKRESSCSSTILPGVGLHLNALANTSKNGKIIKCLTLASGRQIIGVQSSMSSVDSLTTSQNLNESLTLNSMEKDSVPCDHEVNVMENALQTCTSVGGEEFDHSNPMRKRCKLEPTEEIKACKRCNCKRSKCLKLYCECFAAGLYCVEPCSCLACFNKPMYEDTVMETRRQIESRNPLAFAPKVIRSIDSVAEYGDEINKTPASARHKRGCNCKKSSCLKKYCECFQGGVGCSISCRCEGCKNAFGRKDGAEETEYEEEESEAYEKNEPDTNSIDNVIKKGEEECPDLLMIPSDASRGKRSASFLSAFGPSPKLSTRIKLRTDLFYQPKFETRLQVIPEEDTPKIPESNCPPTGGAQSASPNSMRNLPLCHETGSAASRYRTRRLNLRSALSYPSVTSPKDQSCSRETPMV